MKIYDVEIPDDLEIPELSEKDVAELEALREEIKRDRQEQAARLAKSPFKDFQFGCASITTVELPPPTVNVEAMRKMPPRLRAIFVYAHRDHITY
jgi:hypothetical protein